MNITIRIDDLTECMDWPKFYRFKALLDEYNIKPLIGVIPDNKDTMLIGDQTGAPADFWQYIKELQNDGWTIAMHGLNHIYTTKKGGLFPLNDFSEFAGLPYDEQYEMLAYGVDILNEHEIITDMFMAPAHTYDKNTLKALSELGFTKITDGFGKRPYNYKNLTFYPISFNRRSVLNNTDDLSFSTFVYHINTMTEEDFISFEKLLNSYKIISYDKYISYKPKNQTILSRILEHSLASFKKMLIKLK